MFAPNFASVFNRNAQEAREAANSSKELYTSSVPAHLQEVEGKAYKEVDQGPLRLVADLRHQTVSATIGAQSWKFSKEGHVMASLMNEKHQYSYIFAAVNGDADKYWAVVFPKEFPAEEREKFEAILQEHATYHVSERKQHGFAMPSFQEMLKKAQHDTQMLVDQAGKMMQGNAHKAGTAGAAQQPS